MASSRSSRVMDVVLAAELALQLLLLVLVQLGGVQQRFQVAVQLLIGELHLRDAVLVVQRHGGAVFDGTGEVVDADVVAEHLARALFLALDQRRAGEADEAGVGQRVAHVQRKDVVLAAVGLVGDDDHVVLNPATGAKKVVTTVAGYLTPIDVRPNMTPNKVNVTSSGLVTVAILSSNGFDAFKMVDQSTLRFGATGTESSFYACAPTSRDVNYDGLGDLVCRFRIKQTSLKLGDRISILRFTDANGVPREGRDAIVTDMSSTPDPLDFPTTWYASTGKRQASESKIFTHR